MPRSIHTPSEQSRIVSRWRRSGMSAADFAPSVGVSVPTLYLWRRRTVAGGERGAMQPTFVEIAPRSEPSAPSGSGLELLLPRGLVLRIGPGFDAESLRRLVDCLAPGRG